MSPKFSVLLPTRNRLDLAKSAIETVRRQDFADWEIVVADNCSEDDVGSYVTSLADSRIVYTRSDEALPVTQNWNRALARASGDYVVMLGDDDGLVPGYFRRLLDVAAALGAPDFVYHGAYHFAYPGVMPGLPQGALTDVTLYQVILRDRAGPAVLAPEEAHAMARAALDMRAHYAFNMQHFLFSRSFVARMSQYGAFFQGPFPDFYAANMAMLIADRVGILPEPMVFIGISPKSYGYFHFNKKEKGGVSFLNGTGQARPDSDTIEALRQQVLPGTNMNTSWLLSVGLIPGLLPGRNLHANAARYRVLQIADNLKNTARGDVGEAALAELWPHLTWRERMFALALKLFLLPAIVLPRRFRGLYVRIVVDPMLGQYAPPPRNRPRPLLGRYPALLDVFNDIERQSARPSGRA